MSDIKKRLKSLKNERELAQTRRNETLNSSPLVALKEACRKQIESSEKYRVSVLKKVAAFAKLTDHYLLSAAQNMEEMIVPAGTVLIKQDDVGDSFYVVEEGQVSVTRKVNVNDPNEPSIQLAILGSNTYFGEIALLTQEPRTATVTVVSPNAKVLVMTKAKFDMIMDQCSTYLFSDKKEIGREVVNKVPLFQSLSASKRKSVLDSMRPMNFLPNTYICRQGTSGNTFYIIADGQCRVTVNAGHGSEREVTTLGPGDFFGEVALIEPSNKRTANVVSLSNVTCMTLSRADFTQLLSNVRNTLIENSAVRTLALRKVKKETKSTKSHIGKRRITAYDENNQKSYVLVSGFLRKLIKSMTESLYISIYARFYRELILKPDSVDLYGDIGRSIPVMHSSRESAVLAIMNHAHTIGKMDPSERTAAENSFIFGLMVQKNKLRDKICKGWPLYQYRLLCRHIRIISVKPLTKIVESGSNGTSAYVILRGSVRVFSSQPSEVNGKNTLKYEEDLYPGDCFAESALDGIRNRLATIQAITPCDIAVVEYHDYAAATIENNQKESVDDRIQFLTRTPIFRHWDGVDLYRVASVMVREEFPKSTVMISKGDISRKLCLLMEGRIDVVVGLNPHQVQHVVTTINQHECFNESGILTHMSTLQMSNNTTSGNNGDRSENFMETCYAVSGSHVVVLSLTESNYHLLDQSTIEKLSIAFREKNIWRSNRMANLRAESRNINKWKKKIFGERQGEEDPELKWKLTKPKNEPEPIVIESLEEIPTLLDSIVDPMLAISTCRNSKEIRIMQNSIKESYRPKSARVATVRKCLNSGASMINKQNGSKRNLYISTDNQQPEQETIEDISPVAHQEMFSPLQRLRKNEKITDSIQLNDRPNTAPSQSSFNFNNISLNNNNNNNNKSHNSYNKVTIETKLKQYKNKEG
mmetsp:Transcript_24296/g.24905  ORF Transcript_24296/g.24905 Transcript_24296/m.24905 type:complete len:928 (+) Transcript_24296:232-3015(+)